MMKAWVCCLSVLGWMAGAAHAAKKPEPPRPAPIPDYAPARQPVATGEVPVGLVVITFRETAMPKSLSDGLEALNSINGIRLDEYFKIYSNGIVWPKIQLMHDVASHYQTPQFYGYFCEYDYWNNPIGWKTSEEGGKRADRLKEDALKWASKQYRGSTPRFICYNYVTTRPEEAGKEVTVELNRYYQGNRSGDMPKKRVRAPRKSQTKNAPSDAFDPWDYYGPNCRWGDPIWPNSCIQINDFSSGTFAHEFGHSLGAPDVYRMGRHYDGIGNNASLLAYGPTANAFSRFYHHVFIKERNYKTLKTSGTYTLSPRHIDPQGSEVLGYLIPSSHPHYIYHVEYIHGENATVGVGPSHEGMLISVVNLGLGSILGSPDYFYVYRPNDPFFRGTGDTNDCLFGKLHKRTEFNMTTEPSSRLPNLLDGGVSFKNIQENNGTLSFEVVIDHQPVTGSAYANSMLPQIRLDAIQDVQATSFTLDCTIKFRGEPLKTTYGFCWSTRSNPTIKDDTYTLAHRECYRGHAINLKPNTLYHVRAFAGNGVGVRYSDEEKTVQTLDSNTPPVSIGPLCTDGFSENSYLFHHFSWEDESASAAARFIGYSPTCVLAKLISYHRPEKFTVNASGKKSKADPVDFNDLSWNPEEDDCPKRLTTVRDFFGAIYHHSQQLGLHAPKPDKNLVKNLAQLTGVKGKPVVTAFSSGNTGEVMEVIRKDLQLSRPLILIFSYKMGGISAPIRWAMIDGINRNGELHVDFPVNTKFLGPDGVKSMKSGYYAPAALMFQFYQATLVSSLCYKS
jgi:hypothetical protein